MMNFTKMTNYRRIAFFTIVLLAKLSLVDAQLFANVELDAAILEKLQSKDANAEGIIRPVGSNEVKVTVGESITGQVAKQGNLPEPLLSESLPSEAIASESLSTEGLPHHSHEVRPGSASSEKEELQITPPKEKLQVTPPEEKSLPVPSPIPAPPQVKTKSHVFKENPFKPDTGEQDIRGLINQLMTAGGDPKSSVSQLEKSLGIPPGALMKRKNDEGKPNQRSGRNQRNQGNSNQRGNGGSRNSQGQDGNQDSAFTDNHDHAQGTRQRSRPSDRRHRNGDSRSNRRDHSNLDEQFNRRRGVGHEENGDNDQYGRSNGRVRTDHRNSQQSRRQHSSGNNRRDSGRKTSKSRDEFGESFDNNNQFGPGEEFKKLFEEAERKYGGQDQSRGQRQGTRSSGFAERDQNMPQSQYQEENYRDIQLPPPDPKEFPVQRHGNRQRSRNNSLTRSQSTQSRQGNNKSDVDFDYDYESPESFNNNEQFNFNMNPPEQSQRQSRGRQSKQTSRNRARPSKDDFGENFGPDKEFDSFLNSKFDSDYNFDLDKGIDEEGQNGQMRNRNYNQNTKRRPAPDSITSQRQQRGQIRSQRGDGLPPNIIPPRSRHHSRPGSERPQLRNSRPSRNRMRSNHDKEGRYNPEETSYTRRNSNEARPHYSQNGNSDIQPRQASTLSQEGHTRPANRNRVPPRPYLSQSENTYEPTDIDPLSYHTDSSNNAKRGPYQSSQDAALGYPPSQPGPLTYKPTNQDSSYESTDIDPLAYDTTLTDKPNLSPDSRKSEVSQNYNSKDNFYGPDHAPSSPRQRSHNTQRSKSGGSVSNDDMYTSNDHENISPGNGNFNDHMSSSQGSSYRDYVPPVGRELRSQTKQSAATEEAEQQCLQMTARHGGGIVTSRLEQTCKSLRQWGEDMVNGAQWKPTEKIQRWWQSLATPDAVTSTALNDMPRAMKIMNGTESSSRSKRSLTLQFGTLRKEYRMMRHEERKAFHKAVNVLKSETIDGVSKYDIFVHFHHPYYAPGAYFGPALLGWHREYLLRFERALQSVDPSVFLPYWDSSIDGLLEEQAADSVMWMETFAGNAFGRVVNGPFADWSAQTAAGRGILQRNLGWIGQLSMDEADHKPVQDETVNKIMFAKSLQALTWFVDPSIESDIQGTLGWVSGTMDDLTYAPSDPLFFMHYAFIDCIWEQSRLRKLTKQARFDFRSDYPNDTVALGFGMLRPDGGIVKEIKDSFHAALNEMQPFGPLRNIDGVDGDYSRVYACAPRPMCTKKYPHCNSPYLFCDERSWLCVPKLQLSTDCSKFRDFSPCYNAQCCKVPGTFQCQERCEGIKNFGERYYARRSQRRRHRRPHVIT